MALTPGVRMWRPVAPVLRSKGMPDYTYTPTPVAGGVALSGLWATTDNSTGGGSGPSSSGGLVDPATLSAWSAPSDASFPALPSQPTLNYTAFYQSGDTLRSALTRIQNYLVAQGTGTAGYAQVAFPDGFDAEFADFPMADVNKLGLFFNRILGFVGSSWDQVRIRLTPMSSTVGTGGTSVRLAGSSSGALPGGLVPLNYGVTFEGTDQATQAYTQGGETGPQLYSGIFMNNCFGAINQRVRLLGFSQGNWNSPPGETFSWNSYKTTDCIWRACEVSGFNAQGLRRGGSPFGGNQSLRDVIEDCYFHDSYVSGLTWSFAGSSTDPAKASSDPTTRRVRLQWNANWSTASGKAFTGINHENVQGAVFHYNPTIITDQRHQGPNDLWPANHISIKNRLADNTNIKIINPVWNAQHPKYNGCFVVYLGKDYAGDPVGNKQRTYPTVKLGANPDGTGGTTLTPIVVTSSTAPTVTDSPTTHYVLLDP